MPVRRGRRDGRRAANYSPRSIVASHANQNLPLSVQAPDCEVEQRCKCDPCRKRTQTERGNKVKPTEPIDRYQDQQKLRHDVQKPGQRTMQSEKQPRPKRIKQQLQKKHQHRRSSLCASVGNRQDAPDGKGHQHVQPRPDRGKDPVRRIERRFLEPCIPRRQIWIRRQLSQNRSGDHWDHGNRCSQQRRRSKRQLSKIHGSP